MRGFGLKSTLTSGVALFALVSGSEAWAQPKAFSIPAEDAGKSIPELARQAGVQIVAPGERLHGVTTPSLKGTMEVRVALREMLKGTDLVVARDDGQTIVLAAAPKNVQAASNEAAAPRENAGTEAVVVTGSRVIRDGYQSPTPVTVLSADMLNAMADVNIADSINRLPQFTTSVTQTSQPAGIAGGTLGVNELNLRGLGPARTLVLLDGKRMINASINTQFAAPDINGIPNALITRVDVVTGGASAAYGSDALTGVVNFVLDHDYTGLKGKAEGGITTYGDNAAYTDSLTAGTGFGPGDRGHFLISGELSHNDGVRGANRPWNAGGGSVFTNPAYTATNGLPFYLTGTQIGVSTGTPGGLITRGP